VKCEQKNRQDAEFSEQDATKLIAAGKKAGIPPKKLSLVEQLVAHKEDGHRIPLERGALVWLSTMCGSAIPIAPYLFAGVADALPFSLLLALAALFITGAIRAKHTGEDWKASGFEMALVGGIATAAGYVIGSVLKVTI
jgi:VIT1/CCC1 family predicted Fe2+/Mn2+ transporter